MAVDESDVQPDHPLYSSERIGEGIKGTTYAGGQDWQISLAEERVEEFATMVEKGKGQDYANLLEEADSHLSKAITLSEDDVS